ncbi:MAG TPA: glycosyltransferase family 2 protein, partial [Actinophytocola sp.]|nr:glycosyltransferase family 2 protein [Actinophytocola sp.]
PPPPHHPVIVVVRRNAEPGKGYALLDGFARGLGPIVCMIDADLQYPPEAIPEMVAKVRAGADVVVANRVRHHTSVLRRVVSRLSYGFVQALYALDVDVQSGLKVIRREVLDRIYVRPSGWAIDLDILMSAKAGGYVIVGHDIEFDRRRHGETKVRLGRTTWQIARRAIALKVAGLRGASGRPRDAVPIRAPRRVGVEPPATPAA